MSVRVKVDSTRLESLVGGVAARQGLVFGEWQRQGSLEAERVLRANTPVHTGFLRDSIVKQFTPSGFTVYPTASYASALEHGTSPHTIFPSHAKILCFRTGTLGWVFGEGAIFALGELSILGLLVDSSYAKAAMSCEASYGICI